MKYALAVAVLVVVIGACLLWRGRLQKISYRIPEHGVNPTWTNPGSAEPSKDGELSVVTEVIDTTGADYIVSADKDGKLWYRLNGNAPKELK